MEKQKKDDELKKREKWFGRQLKSPLKRMYKQEVKRIQRSTAAKAKSGFNKAEELPKDIMRGLSYEKSEKQSTSKRDVYIVRSSDRETDRDEILRNLNQAGIKSSLGTSSSSLALTSSIAAAIPPIMFMNGSVSNVGRKSTDTSKLPGWETQLRP